MMMYRMTSEVRFIIVWFIRGTCQFSNFRRLTPTPSKPKHRPTSKTPFKWRFAGGSIVAGEGLLTGQSAKDHQNVKKMNNVQGKV